MVLKKYFMSFENMEVKPEVSTVISEDRLRVLGT
jgi:hypothetical protein